MLRTLQVQGPKLTFLYGCQVATEIFFFSRQMENSARQQVSAKLLLHSETRSL